MARLQDMAKRVDMYQMPVGLIDIDPTFNVRGDTPAVREHILALAESIKAGGFMQTKPLTIRLVGDRAVITDGHCRFAAVRLAMAEGCEIDTLPCLPETRGTNEADRSLMLLTSNSGLPLSGLEQAEVVKRLLGFGWDEHKIAARIGRTRQHVASLLELAEAPMEVQAMVRAGSVSPTVAIATMRADGGNAAAVLKAAVAASPRGRATAGTVKASRPAAPVAPVDDAEGIIGDDALVADTGASDLLRAARAVVAAWYDEQGSDAMARAMAVLQGLVS